MQKILDKENVIPNVGALAVKKPKIQVYVALGQFAKVLDPQLLDKSDQEIWFLDEAILMNVVSRVS